MTYRILPHGQAAIRHLSDHYYHVCFRVVVSLTAPLEVHVIFREPSQPEKRWQWGATKAPLENPTSVAADRCLGALGPVIHLRMTDGLCQMPSRDSNNSDTVLACKQFHVNLLTLYVRLIYRRRLVQ